MRSIEELEKRRDNLKNLQDEMAAKLRVHPNDYGVRVWWGFLIVGFLVGWMRSHDVGTTMLYGILFSMAGMFFCIFVLDSAEVQSKVAILIGERFGMRRISNWLYKRALTIR